MRPLVQFNALWPWGRRIQDSDDLYEVCNDYLAKEERRSDVVDDKYSYGNRDRLFFLEIAISNQKHLERLQDRMEAKHEVKHDQME
jgi:hypothetical protein